MDTTARVEGTEGDAGGGGRLERARARLRDGGPPLWTFLAAVAATVPLVMFVYGRHQWFLRDEWFLLSDSEGFPDLLAPSAGAHLIIVPRLIYRVLWEIWGIRTYTPYLLANLSLHLLLVVALRSVMRRSGVTPWLATAAALPMLLFGPGSEGLLLAFQVGFTGSIAWGVVQLVLADVEGGIQKRDVLALGAGFLAITSSGIGVTTTFMVGAALLLRRGWRAAAFQTVPLGITYAAWALLEDVSSESVAGRPSISTLLEWDLSALRGTLIGLGHFPVIAVAYVVMVLVAAVLVLGPWRDRSWAQLRRELAFPVGMAVAVAFFATTTGIGRWHIGTDGARLSRYVYLQAAFTLPLLAASAQIIARRWRRATPVLLALFLVPIPFNLDGFGTTFFGERYFDEREYILTTAVRMPFAHDVPPSVRPVPDPFDSDGLTIGYLLRAEEEGRLVPSTVPLTPEVVNEFRVRLGFAPSTEPETVAPPALEDCTWDDTLDISPEQGERMLVSSAVRVWTTDGPGGETTSPAVSFRPEKREPVSLFTAELPDLHLRLDAPGDDPVFLCQVPE